MAKKTITATDRKRVARRKYVAEYICKEYSIRQICEMVGKEMNTPTISTSVIHSDISALLEEWRNEARERIEMALPLELAKIAKAECELWEAWEQSKTDPNAGEKAAKRAGDPRYITELRYQQMERRRLLGLYAPQKLEAKTEGAQRLIIEVSSAESARALEELKEINPRE